MHRVRIRMTNPDFSTVSPVILESRQASRSLENGATVSWDVVAGPARLHNRIELIFSFSDESDAERTKIVNQFLTDTLHVGRKGQSAIAENIRSYGVVLPRNI